MQRRLRGPRHCFTRQYSPCKAGRRIITMDLLDGGDKLKNKQVWALPYLTLMSRVPCKVVDHCLSSPRKQKVMTRKQIFLLFCCWKNFHKNAKYQRNNKAEFINHFETFQGLSRKHEKRRRRRRKRKINSISRRFAPGLAPMFIGGLEGVSLRAGKSSKSYPPRMLKELIRRRVRLVGWNGNSPMPIVEHLRNVFLVHSTQASQDLARRKLSFQMSCDGSGELFNYFCGQ